MNEETRDPSEQEHPRRHRLTHSTDERAVSDKQKSKWISEGGALPADYDPDLDADENEEE